ARHAAPLRLAQQRQRADADAVVAHQEAERMHFAPGLLDQIDARLRGVAMVVEDAKNSPVRRGGGQEEEDGHDRAKEAQSPGEIAWSGPDRYFPCARNA